MLRDNYNWDGRERRLNDRRIVQDESYYHEQPQPQIIVEQPQQQPNKLLSPTVIAGILYPIIAALASFIWAANDKITAIEYKVQSSVDRQTQHERDDIEFKNELKELNLKIDKLKEQIASIDSTVLQVLSESVRHPHRGS